MIYEPQIPQIFNTTSIRYSQMSVKLHTLTFSRNSRYLGLHKNTNINNLRGGHMRIKFLRTENLVTNPNAAGKTYPMLRIVGEALEGKLLGQEWSTKFFPSMKDMASVAKSAKVGDVIDVVMKVNGKYMNPESMSIVDPALAKVYEPTVASTLISAAPVNKEKERKDNLAIAVNIMGAKKPKDDAVEYLVDASGVADLIEDYAKETGPFQFDKDTAKNGIPEVDSDDMEAPDEEEVKEVGV